jgi:thioredoxin reductase
MYAGVVEHSVYVDPAAQGHGVGRVLLDTLIASTEQAGIWTIQSGVFPENTASLALHHRAGNRPQRSITMKDQSDLPVVVVGAGPVGLAAAAHLAERDLPFLVVESGPGPGAAIAEWGHVRLFSPWRYNIDPAARRLLDIAGWAEPDPAVLPTGAELVEGYLQPLAKLPALAAYVRYQAHVTGVSRLGFDRVRTAGREQAPFLVQLADGTDILARAVLDASGTWRTPNVLGASGLPAVGEPDAAAFIDSALPNVLGADRDRFAGRHTLVIGAGHSAANTILALADLAAAEPETAVTWAIRAGSPTRTYGGGDADALPARGALGATLRGHVEAGRVRLLTGFYSHTLRANGDQVQVVSRDPEGVEQSVTVDRIVAATGFRPDHTLAGELRLDLDPVLGATRALAPLIDPNEHSCGTVPPHGEAELKHPEPGFYAVGVKSYGRAPTFLLATGYEQVRSIAAALAGDWDAARDVQLDLPETGVCSTDLVYGNASTAGGCCGTEPATTVSAPAGRGLATGGRLAAPLTLTLTGTTPAASGGGCCGG